MDDIAFYYPEGHEGHFERGHPERPERIEVIKSALVKEHIWDRSPKLPAFELSRDLIRSIHSQSYLNVLELTCKRSGHLDPDTYTTTASWDLAQETAGGAAAVASAVWERKAGRGFAITRRQVCAISGQR
jgi:acetoin utilization deacetylase AcuC-like enzyme